MVDTRSGLGVLLRLAATRTKGLALVQMLVVDSRRGMQTGQQLCIQQQFWLTAAGR